MTTPRTSRDTRSARQVSRKAIPLEKAEIHDTAYTANDDMLDDDITPSDPVVIFRISVCLDTLAVFKIIIDDGTTEVDIALNGGAQLTAQAGYTFDWPINTGDAVNFEADQSVQIEKLIVHEVLWATQ